MRAIIDEDLPRSLAPLLREKGYEVYDTRDVGLRGHSDEEIFKFAQNKNARRNCHQRFAPFNRCFFSTPD